jgi:hypothetical protein
MTARRYLWLSLLGLGVVLLGSRFQAVPGYMDAEYYYAGGLRLAGGYGFSEEILWNYLDDPAGLPHPSHGYWMPLVSMLAAAGMKLVGISQFPAARLIFLALVAAIPPLSARLSYSLTGQVDQATVAGLLGALPGFYLPYLATTDAFVLYIVFGALFLLLVRGHWRDVGRAYPPVASFLLGLLAGLMHLTRTDGFSWLFVAGVAVFMQARELSRRRGILGFWGLCLLGYLLVMGPWMARNYRAFGALFSPGGWRVLWFTGYDELFIYPAELLTFERWWSSGLRTIVGDRLWAAGQNLQTALAVQGLIFIAPLVLIGLWRLRGDRRVLVALLAWGLTFLTMTVVFPYAGARGGFFHSGAALQTLWWAVAPLGLVELVRWAGRLRRWRIQQAQRVFQTGLIGLAALLTGAVFYLRVIGLDYLHPAWAAGYERYASLEAFLSKAGAGSNDLVIVNNSPGYYLAGGRPAISIPYGDFPTVLAVAGRYQARYLILEIDQVQGEEDLYHAPGDRPGVAFLGSVADARIYQFVALGE